VGQAVDERAPAVHQDAGGRKRDAFAEEPGQLAPADPLAPQNGIEIGQQQLDRANLGIRRQKLGRLRGHAFRLVGHRSFSRDGF